MWFGSQSIYPRRSKRVGKGGSHKMEGLQAKYVLTRARSSPVALEATKRPYEIVNDWKKRLSCKVLSSVEGASFNIT
jgi:hypothetical protein